MKLDHDEIKEMLPEYLNESLTEEMRNAVEIHLRNCEKCRSELSFIKELIIADAPDPGDLFWEFLPQRVRVAVEEEKSNRFSLKSLLFKQLPIAATIVALLVLIFSYEKSGDITEYDPFFKDPFAAEVIDYSVITENDILSITEYLADNELYLRSDNLMDYSYYREFASLNSRELDNLYETLKIEQQSGGKNGKEFT